MIVYVFQISMYSVYKLNILTLYYFYAYIFDGILALGCGPGTDYPTHIFQCMLERTDAITNEVLEPITFVLAYRTVFYIIINVVCRMGFHIMY